VVLLCRLRQPTFFTRDLGFYTPELRHQHYAIVVAGVLAAPERSCGSRRVASHGGSCGDNKRRSWPGKHALRRTPPLFRCDSIRGGTRSSRAVFRREFESSR
jgi:hypothetical protein